MGLRAQLDNIRGVSQHIIVVFVDIRGFSVFSQTQDSADVGVFIAQAFKRLIDDYFPFATFCKSTGDGLLLTVPYDDEDTLKTNARSVVEASLKAISDFPTICNDNPLVNFPCPDKIGFGIARGAACCLVNGDEVVDFSGHRLNLAARLMDLARPLGIVLDGNFDLSILPSDLQDLFQEEEVYIRSLAEARPHKIFYQKETVEIREQAKRPLVTETWTRESISPTPHGSKTLKDWEYLGDTPLRFDLKSRVKQEGAVRVTAKVPMKRGGKIFSSMVTYEALESPLGFTYVEAGNDAYIRLVPKTFVELAQSRKLPKSAVISVEVAYLASD